MSKQRLALALVLCPLMLACDDSPPPTGPQVAIDVAALNLQGVGDVVWDIQVISGAGGTVWQKRVTSSGYGDSAGSASLVGPCDADTGAATNTVNVWVVGVYADDISAADAGVFALGDASGVVGTPVPFENPTENTALTRTFTCVPNGDTAVTFDVTLARPAQQGFFDVAVTFSDIFCSAKLDCVDQAGDPLELLFDGTTRKRTVVVALACTGDLAATGETWLYRDDVVVTCDAGSATVNPSAGPGNLTEGNGFSSTGTSPLFGAAVYRGEEHLGANKRYWNVLLGLRDSAANCVVTTNATASPEALAGAGPYTTPVGTTWPYITWDVAVTLPGCTTHPIYGQGVHAGVATAYTSASAPEPFARAYGPTALPSGPTLCSDGQTDCAVSDCNTLLNSGLAIDDGPYAIDPDGAGTGAPAFTAYCDMTTDGGGWTLVARDYGASGGAALNVAGAVGSLSSPTQASSAKLEDAVINALRGDLATSLVRSRCGAVTTYYNQDQAFSATVTNETLTRCAATWNAAIWYNATWDSTTVGLSTYVAAPDCGGYQIWYYTSFGYCYPAGEGTTWVKAEYTGPPNPNGPQGSSCATILAAQPSATSGVYLIDPDATGPTAPFEVWCDMTPGDGGWTYGLIVNTDTDSASRTRVAGYSSFGTAAGPLQGTEYGRDLTGISFSEIRIDNFALGTSVSRTIAAPQAWGGGNYSSGGGLPAARIDIAGGEQFRAGYYVAGSNQIIPVCFVPNTISLSWVCDTDSGPIEGWLDPSGGELCSPSGIGQKIWRDPAQAPNPCVSYLGAAPPAVYGLAIR